MLVVALAIILWLLIALPSALLLSRYGCASSGEVSAALISSRYARALLFLDPRVNYLLATLFLVVAYWRAVGWGLGIGSFMMAAGIFTWVHTASQKRAFRKIYTDLTSTTSHAVQTGDTLASLASAHDVAAKKIATANGLASEAPLEPETELLIPGKPPEKAMQLARTIMSKRRFWPPSTQ